MAPPVRLPQTPKLGPKDQQERSDDVKVPKDFLLSLLLVLP